MAVLPEILIPRQWVPAELDARLRTWSPKSELGRIVRECLWHLPAELAAELIDKITSCAVVESSLSVVVVRHPDSPWRGRSLVEDYGVVCRKVVTTAGVNFIVDAFQNLVEVEILKYHGIGTGTNAEAVGDTALQTELTTQYNPDSTRATGTTTEGASANIYRTVDASVAITEHGIFSQAATGGGTLLDRSVFSAVNLVNGDSIQTTYDLTFSAGG
jgi:hypothetical protein